MHVDVVKHHLQQLFLPVPQVFLANPSTPIAVTMTECDRIGRDWNNCRDCIGVYLTGTHTHARARLSVNMNRDAIYATPPPCHAMHPPCCYASMHVDTMVHAAIQQYPLVAWGMLRCRTHAGCMRSTGCAASSREPGSIRAGCVTSEAGYPPYPRAGPSEGLCCSG